MGYQTGQFQTSFVLTGNAFSKSVMANLEAGISYEPQ